MSRLLPWAIGASAVGGIAAVVFLEWKRPADAHALAGIAAVAAIGGTASLWFDMQRRWKPQLIAAFGALWLATVGVQTFVMPSHDSFRPLAELGERTANFVPAGTTVHLVSLPEVQIPYYIDRTQRRWDQIELFDPRAAAANSSDVFVITSRDMLDTLEKKVGPVEVLDSATRKAHHTFDRDRLVLVRISVDGATAATAKTPGESTRR